MWDCLWAGRKGLKSVALMVAMRVESRVVRSVSWSVEGRVVLKDARRVVL
jgi:hypothetical protein